MLTVKKILISRGEMIESLEYYDLRKLKFYIYSYKIFKGRKWITITRWDNLDGMEHMDIYDENGNYIETREFPKRNFEDIVKLIKTFRRNIIAMDLSNL